MLLGLGRVKGSARWGGVGRGWGRVGDGGLGTVVACFEFNMRYNCELQATQCRSEFMVSMAKPEVNGVSCIMQEGDGHVHHSQVWDSLSFETRNFAHAWRIFYHSLDEGEWRKCL